MDWQTLLIIYAVVLLFLLLSGVWVAAAMGLAGLIGLLIINPTLMLAVGSVVWDTANSFLMSCIPLFLFMGAVFLHAGLNVRLYESLSRWLGRIPGGLAHSNVAAGAMFAAVSGSSIAAISTISAVAIPGMAGRGYDKRLIYGSVGCSGTLGILIPPSLPLVVYAAIVGESVGRLFMAGIIPGLILAALFSLTILIRVLLNPQLGVVEPRYTWKERLVGLKDIVPMGLLIALVLGSFYFGIAGPTEIAGLGAVGVVVIAITKRQFDFSVLKESLLSAARTTAMMMFILVGAQIMSFGMVSAGIPRGIIDSIASMQVSPTAILAVIIMVYVVLGLFIEAFPMMLLTLPVVYPIMTSLGFDLVWFGIVVVVLMEAALITPPVGFNLYVIQGVAKESSFRVVVLALLPFVIPLLALLVLLCIFPSIALWLPGRMH